MAWTSSLTITLGNATKKSEIDAAFNNTLFMQTKGADIASATPDIGAASGLFVDVTGTTAITALGTVAAGTLRIVRFTGALTLTHNATSLILPGGANILTVNGDTAIFESLGSGNWKCVAYQRVAEVTNPAQPAFLVNLGASMGNPASGTTITMDVEVFDQGSDFAANTFTAPVTGRYQFSFSVLINGADTARTYLQIRLVTSNRNYDFYFPVTTLSADADNVGFNGAILADMDAADTAYLQYNYGGGAQQDTIVGALVNTRFSGFLAC